MWLNIEPQPSVFEYYAIYLEIFLFHNRNDAFARFYSAAVSILNVYTLSVLAYSFFTYIPDLNRMAVVLHHFLVAFDMSCHVIIFYYYRQIVKKIFAGFYYTHDYNSKLMTKLYEEINKSREVKMKKVFIGNCCSVVVILSLVLLTAFSDRFLMERSEYFLLIPTRFTLPLEEMYGYVTALIWQAIACIIGVGMLFGLFNALYIFYIKITTEFQILDYALATIPKRAREIKRRMEKTQKTSVQDMDDCYNEAIRHCVIHHLAIISIFNDVRLIERWVYFIGNAVSLGLLVITGFTLVSDDLLLKIEFVTIMMFTMGYVFFFYWVGQNIGDESQNILLTLHTAEWLDMPKKCRNSLRLMMTRTMKPLVITSLDGIDITMENFMSLVSASYSYFNLVLQMRG